MIELKLLDEEYPFSGFTHTRIVARGIVLNEHGLVALHHIVRNDIFGKQQYFETPGGGVDEGEMIEEALKRECSEELGEDVEIIRKLGVVEDAYNIIHRRNVNHYYLCRKLNQSQTHFVSEGDALIQETLWLDLNKAIEAMESQEDEGVALLVKRRELPILKEAKRILEEGKPKMVANEAAGKEKS